MGLSVTCDTCGKAVGNPACPTCRRSSASQEPALGAPKERRDPRRQRPQPEGNRATDPSLGTRACAQRLGVDTDFIIGEIRDGRLKATVIEREGKRTVYRIAPLDFEDYRRRHCWNQSENAS